jgi:hypothetical protein
VFPRPAPARNLGGDNSRTDAGINRKRCTEKVASNRSIATFRVSSPIKTAQFGQVFLEVDQRDGPGQVQTKMAFQGLANRKNKFPTGGVIVTLLLPLGLLVVTVYPLVAHPGDTAASDEGAVEGVFDPTAPR